MPRSASQTIGRYQIQRTLGVGGMGAVYLARDPVIDRLLAIKLMREGVDTPEVRERFMREARSAGRLRHPNIVTIFDVGEHDGQPFIAMEYIEGRTLADLIRHQAAVPLTRRLQLVEDLCAGLYYAHRAGIVHRDVKPANVILGEDGLVKILDFGIARIGGAGITQGIVGTLNYMAPEQLEGKEIDPRTDIFAVGALFYELLSYRRAFPGDLSDGILTKILAGRPEPLESLVPHLDSPLVAMVNRCLEKKPASRYPDCAALARDIAAVRSRLQESEPRHSETTQLLGADPDAPKSPRTPPPRRPSQRVEHVIVIDPEDAEAAEMADHERLVFEEAQIRKWVSEGQDELERGELTAASVLVERALSINSMSPEAQALRRAVDEARRQLAEAQERAQRIHAAIAFAERDLKAGLLDRAAEAVDEALAVDATHAQALALRARVASAVERRTRLRDEARAKKRGRQPFAGGEHASSWRHEDDSRRLIDDADLQVLEAHPSPSETVGERLPLGGGAMASVATVTPPPARRRISAAAVLLAAIVAIIGLVLLLKALMP